MKNLRIALLGLALAVSAGCASRAAVIRIEPPMPQVETPGPRPGPRHVWISGRWAWRGGHHVWIPGHWVKAKHGQLWIDGHWKRHGRGWVWEPGHWKK